MNPRPPKNDQDLRYWLEVMVWYHTMSDEEIAAATGLSLADLQRERAPWDIQPQNRAPEVEP